MIRMIRSTFTDPETIDAVDSYESPNDEQFEDELKRAGDFFQNSISTEGDPFTDSDHYERTSSAIELAYYSDYDPMVGFRIAISLGVLILLFTVFVLYKTHCHQQKNRRLTQNAQY